MSGDTRSPARIRLEPPPLPTSTSSGGVSALRGQYGLGCRDCPTRLMPCASCGPRRASGQAQPSSDSAARGPSHRQELTVSPLTSAPSLRSDDKAAHCLRLPPFPGIQSVELCRPALPPCTSPGTSWDVGATAETLRAIFMLMQPHRNADIKGRCSSYFAW